MAGQPADHADRHARLSQSGQLSPETAQAIGFFAVALFFANLADATQRGLHRIREDGVSGQPSPLPIAVAKVALGALVLLPPFDMGFVGLAGVSLVMNIVQVVWLYVVMRRTVLPSEPGPRRSRLDWPLPALHAGRIRPADDQQPAGKRLLADQPLGSAMVRRGDVGRHLLGGVKYLDGLNVIPAYFTLAIFPLMSRYAQGQSDSLARAYRLAVQLLFILSLPIAVSFTFARHAVDPHPGRRGLPAGLRHRAPAS